jgi:mxaL protein
MLTLARVIRAFPEPAQVVYFSDGEEAPKLHAFNTKDLANFQGGNGWLFVGIGSLEGAPIPKFDENNQLIGYWSNDSFAMQPGIAQISEANLGTRDDNVASGTGDRFISKLQEDYLKALSKEVNGNYVRGDSLQSILSAMKQQKPARTDIAPYGIHWILASIAALLVLINYLPKNPLKVFGKLIFQSRKKIKAGTQ